MSPLELRVPGHVVDDDPWPRAAAVQPSSAYRAVELAVVAPVLAVTVGAGSEPAAPRRVTPLRTWQFAAADRDPRSVVVPDTWSRRDPSLADFRGPAEYRRVVESSGSRARLVFDALDYFATVEIDGEVAATHEGGFTPVSVEVPTGRPVVVTVRLDDPVEEALLEPSPMAKPKRKVKGVQELHDSRPGGMPIGPHFDATWATRWGSGGIQDVPYLHETGGVRIDAAFVTAVPGELRVSWVLTALGADCDAVVVATVSDGPGFTIATRLVRGANRLSVRLDTTGEEAWSPERPVTHVLRSAVEVDGQQSDAHRTRFGFRRVEMELEGEQQLQLVLDGQPRYVRAANYIGGVWPSELEDDVVRRDAELALAAGLNSLGVHAGVCRPMLDAADEMGLLIYQDFPLQWSYDATEAFTTASLLLTAELAYDLYNHPSIVYWCGHNEPAYQLGEVVQGAEVPELLRLAADLEAAPDEEPVDQRRVELLRLVDPTRPATMASGLGATRPAGDHHDYAGSLSGGSVSDIANGSVPFVSEYGAWSANFSAAADVPGARGDWPPPPETERDWYEQTHLYSVQVSYAGRPERYEDFATWCFAGQLWAGWHAKVATERSRLAKYGPSRAHRYHFFVDHWGAAGAGVVDRRRTTGPAYRGLAAANRPVVALAPMPDRGVVRPGADLRLPIVVVNDTRVPLAAAAVRWRLAALGADDCHLVGRDDPIIPGALGGAPSPPDQCAVLPRRRGRTVREGELVVDVGADSIAAVTEVAWTAEDEGPVALFLDVDGVAGWTSFTVAAEGWSPVPGLTGPRRFRVTTDRPAPLVRRWTGEEVDPMAAPPDQYLLGGVPLDVFDDVHVAVDGTVSSSPLPWADPT